MHYLSAVCNSKLLALRQLKSTCSQSKMYNTFIRLSVCDSVVTACCQTQPSFILVSRLKVCEAAAIAR